MKKLFVFCVSIFSFFLSSAQDLTLVKEDWRCGLKNADGEMVIPYSWEAILPIKGCDNFFVVKLGDKYGLIDDHGKVIIDARCSYIIPRFFDGKVLINIDGTSVSTVTDSIEVINSAYMKYKKAGTAEQVVSTYVKMEKVDWLPHDDFYSVGGKWGIYNLREFIPSISPSYDLIQILPDEDRYIALGYTYGQSDNYNIYDFQTGTFVYEFESKNKHIRSSMTLLSGGYALINGGLVRFSNGNEEALIKKVQTVIDVNDRYALVEAKKDNGVFDKTRGMIVHGGITTYNTCETSKEKFAVQTQDGRWLIFDGNRQYVVTLPQDRVIEYLGDFALATNSDSPSSFIMKGDGDGIMYTSSINKYVNQDEGKTLLFIDTNSDLIKLDSKDMEAVKIYSGCTDFDMYLSNPEYVKIAIASGWANKYGIVDLRDMTVKVPFEHDNVVILNDNLYYTVKGSKCTMRSFDNPDYSMDFFSIMCDRGNDGDRCWIWKEAGGSAALFDMDTHTFLTEPLYSPQVFLKNNQLPIMIDRQFFPVTNGSKWGVMDKDGNVVIDFKYANVFPFISSEGFFPVMDTNGQFGYVNPYTKVELPCVFEDIAKFDHGMCGVKMNGKWGIANASGDVLFYPKYDSIGDFYGQVSWLKKDMFIHPITIAVKGTNTFDWIESTGKVLCTVPYEMPSINAVIPDGLWDF